jgi:hypothetical protein
MDAEEDSEDEELASNPGSYICFACQTTHQGGCPASLPAWTWLVRLRREAARARGLRCLECGSVRHDTGEHITGWVPVYGVPRLVMGPGVICGVCGGGHSSLWHRPGDEMMRGEWE